MADAEGEEPTAPAEKLPWQTGEDGIPTLVWKYPRTFLRDGHHLHIRKIG
jgi:hypothetical protein